MDINCKHSRSKRQYWIGGGEQRNDQICTECGRNLTVGAPSGAPFGDTRAGPRWSKAQGVRRFECTVGGSQKFWEVIRNGTTHVVRYGRLGTTGQTFTKEHGSALRATTAIDKLVASKLRKGYVEKGDRILKAATKRSPLAAGETITGSVSGARATLTAIYPEDSFRVRTQAAADLAKAKAKKAAMTVARLAAETPEEFVFKRKRQKLDVDEPVVEFKFKRKRQKLDTSCSHRTASRRLWVAEGGKQRHDFFCLTCGQNLGASIKPGERFG